MKKIVLILSMFLSIFMLTTIASSSSYVTFKGTYENKQIKLVAFNGIASWITRRSSGSSHKIKFTIMAKPGYKLIGKYNRIVYYGIHFTFKPKNNNFKSYTKAVALGTGSFIKSAVFKLRYFISKSDGSKRKFVTKKFKMTMERRARGSHDNVKMIIKEI